MATGYDINNEDKEGISSNILILGNGFDIAHGLRTSYENFVSSTEKIINGKIDEPLVSEYEKRLLSNGYNSAKLGENLIFKLIFSSRITGTSEDWKDLERLIGVLVRCLSNFADFDCIESKVKHELYADHYCYVFLQQLTDKISDYNNYRKIGKVTENIKKDFGIFKEVLLIYLTTVLETTKLINKEEIDNNKREFSTIITLNYTDTFERLYDKSNGYRKVYHLHGSIADNDLVLGTLMKSDKKVPDTSFYPFYKDIQQINTDNTTTPKVIIEKCKDAEYIVTYGFSWSINDKHIIDAMLESGKRIVIVRYDDQKGSKEALNTSITEYLSSINKSLIDMVSDGTITFIDEFGNNQFQDFLIDLEKAKEDNSYFF